MTYPAYPGWYPAIGSTVNPMPLAEIYRGKSDKAFAEGFRIRKDGILTAVQNAAEEGKYFIREYTCEDKAVFKQVKDWLEDNGFSWRVEFYPFWQKDSLIISWGEVPQ